MRTGAKDVGAALFWRKRQPAYPLTLQISDEQIEVLAQQRLDVGARVALDHLGADQKHRMASPAFSGNET